MSENISKGGEIVPTGKVYHFDGSIIEEYIFIHGPYTINMVAFLDTEIGITETKLSRGWYKLTIDQKRNVNIVKVTPPALRSRSSGVGLAVGYRYVHQR